MPLYHDILDTESDNKVIGIDNLDGHIKFVLNLLNYEIDECRGCWEDVPEFENPEEVEEKRAALMDAREEFASAIPHIEAAHQHLQIAFPTIYKRLEVE
jgi:hypothetical protein